MVDGGCLADTLVISQRGRGQSKWLRAWSPKNWSRFLQQSTDLTVEMSAKYSTLNDGGYPYTPSLTVSAYQSVRAPGWLTLTVSHAHADQSMQPPDDVAERWRIFLLRQAEQTAPVFGFLADDGLDAGTRTPLEATSAVFPEDTLPLTDSEVRGYSWITITSAGVLDRLGGPAVLGGSNAFSAVTKLPSGGAFLQATPQLSGYDGRAVRKVFAALSPALPGKAPRPMTSTGSNSSTSPRDLARRPPDEVRRRPLFRARSWPSGQSSGVVTKSISSSTRPNRAGSRSA